MEGTISNINSDQTDSYFKIGSESKKISDNKKIDNGSGWTSKEYEEEKIQSIEEPAYICMNHLIFVLFCILFTLKMCIYKIN